MKILFIGDIVGGPGRRCVRKLLPGVAADHAVDIIIANAENAAGGLGVTPKIVDELVKMGIHGFTMGNHTWRKKELVGAIDDIPNIVRPANYPANVPGKDRMIVRGSNGAELGVTNVLGRVYMEPFNDPFETALEIAEDLREETPVVLVDMHAEATSEKVAISAYLDGTCTAVVGTHTHVQTADERVLPRGTAAITDVGMTGPRDSVIGVRTDVVIRKFLTGMPEKFDVAEGRAIFNAVVIDADETTGLARSIERINESEPGN